MTCGFKNRLMLLWTVPLVTVSAVSSRALAQDAVKQQAAEKPPRASIYNEKADAHADIAAAVARAGKDNKRVLVMFGANWCGWCHKLHEVFKSNREIARSLLYEYEIVLVDIGKWDKNLDIAKAYGADIKKHGVPFLTVLGADGKSLANQDTGSLEQGDHHDPAKVQAFLTKFQAKPWDAQQIYDKALATADAKGKMVFLHFGAPWCGWCHKLEAFLEQDEIASIMNRDFVDLKIDIDRMTGGKDLQTRFRPSGGGGIPWFAMLDTHGKVLVSADGPKGNIGFPVEKHEIAHFIDMLTKTRKNISADDTNAIEKALAASAKKIKAGRGG